MRESLVLENKGIKQIKIGIWLYLILLIFEGALRKWVLPGLSNPLLLIRDPLALWLLFLGSKYHINYSNVYTKFMLPFTLLCAYVALLFCHQNYYVAAFGSRITILHFPLVFLFAKVLTKDDVLQIGRFLIYLTFPMLVLIIWQFYSPQSAWVNRGVGGNLEGAGYSGAEGYFRPPATFSFTTGATNFFSFVWPFVFYFLFYSNFLKKWIVYAALGALLASVLFSISRTLLFNSVISFGFVLLTFGNNKRQLNKILGGIVALVLILYCVSFIDALGTPLQVFLSRFTSANEQEGGLVNGVFLDRFLGGLLNGLITSGDAGRSFFGFGIGYGTNFATKLLTNGEILFLVDEVEWGRIIGELGPLLGILLVFIRVITTVEAFRRARFKLRNGESLGWILLGFSFIVLLQGGWSTPTNLGFYVMAGGLTFAAIK